MRTFTLELQDSAQSERVEGVTRFVGEDRSGQFGIRAHHERMMTLLSFGLARFCVGEGQWEFLALPGGLLVFADNTLTIATSHYLRDTDPQRLGEALDARLAREEAAVATLKENVHRLEEALVRRLWRMTRGRTG